mmetsp:Transcript_20230/g.41678  ORF Transcript_20230/g.41678 Transcript_20230/m.41678 type:complete len:171 (-) Transcript_20230:1714-2226(-)
MANLVADEDCPFFIKKIWCHGQSVIPPIIGIASLCYARLEPNCASGFWMGLIVPLILCIWPFVSWKAIVDTTITTDAATIPSSLLPVPSGMAMRGARRKRCRQVLLWGGVLVLAVYLSILLGILGKCGGNESKGLKLTLLIFSALAAIETVAFLGMMATCLPNGSRQLDE